MYIDVYMQKAERYVQVMIPILYADKHFLICCKPIGVISESPGLPDILQEQLGCRVYPVHRLDQGTGGLCMLAFSAGACTSLQNLFLQGKVKKKYLAVISGSCESQKGSFRDFLYHDKRSNKSYVVKQKRKGVKEALCDWDVIGSSFCDDQLLSLVCVSLHTGRTHQIRVQFSSRGLPLVGDRKYGSRIKADSPALWAYSLSFLHPWQEGLSVAVSVPPKEAFPWTLFDLSSL